MKKTITIFLLGILLVSCKQTITDKDVAKINGYWEIQKVELPQGGKKEYKVNETIDFFQIKDNKGSKKKLHSLGSVNFLKIEPSNHIFFSFSSFDNRTINIQE